MDVKNCYIFFLLIPFSLTLSAAPFQWGKQSWYLLLHHSPSIHLASCVLLESSLLMSKIDQFTTVASCSFVWFSCPLPPLIVAFSVKLSRISERRLCALNTERRRCLGIFEANCLLNRLNADYWFLVYEGIKKLIWMACVHTHAHKNTFRYSTISTWMLRDKCFPTHCSKYVDMYTFVETHDILIEEHIHIHTNTEFNSGNNFRYLKY